MKNPAYLYRAQNVRVIDGDTIDADVDLGFRVWQRLRFRLARIDAYELRSPVPEERDKATRVKNMLQKDFIECEKVVIRSEKTEKYGRWLAEVWIDDLNMNDELLKSGLVKEMGPNGEHKG